MHINLNYSISQKLFIPEAYLTACPTSTMEFSAKIVNDF